MGQSIQIEKIYINFCRYLSKESNISGELIFDDQF